MNCVANGKKIINTLGTWPDDSLAGLAFIHPNLQRLEGHRAMVRSDLEYVMRSSKVTLLAGGQCGNEPADTGYIGKGMLSAAVEGHIFKSPDVSSILVTIRTVGINNPAGVLVIIKNNKNDRLSFGQAVERAKGEGIKIDIIMVDDDCSQISDQATEREGGRAGHCGAVFMYKIAGALAEKKCSLQGIIRAIKSARENMRTIGLCLVPCNEPETGPNFTLEEDEMAFGVGISGLPGVKRIKMCTSKKAVEILLDHMLNPESVNRLKIKPGDGVAVMINNLGGLTMMELYIVANDVYKYLEEHDIKVERAFVGTFMSCLNMAGVSITLLIVDQALKACLDFPTTAPAWMEPAVPEPELAEFQLYKGRAVPPPRKFDYRGFNIREFHIPPPKTYIPTPKNYNTSAICRVDSSHQRGNAPLVSEDEANRLYSILQCVSRDLLAAEGHLNSLVSQTDVDCGTTIAKGAKMILEQLGTPENSKLPLKCPYELALSLSQIAENVIGGTYGELYSLFFLEAAIPLQKGVEAKDWCLALEAGLMAVMRYSDAIPGERTMVDPLHSAFSVLNAQIANASPIEAFAMAVKAAESAVDAPASMTDKEDTANNDTPNLLAKPDPGAFIVTTWMKAILSKLT